jgi:hypothetical protein
MLFGGFYRARQMNPASRFAARRLSQTFGVDTMIA